MVTFNVQMSARDQSGLRKGYTTGACAAAAGKGAALMLLTGEVVEEVSIPMPSGDRAAFELVRQEMDAQCARCGVVKDAGDDPDVTHGAVIMARAEWSDGGFRLRGGEGVGMVTKPGLQVPVGEAAINPVPRLMIREAVREVTERGVEITVSVPDGKELARRTFNPRLGIVGGISIIGTMGIVEPKSSDALKTSLLCALDVARAQGYDSLAMVPGRIGEKGVKRLIQLEEDQVVQMGNYVGFMLEAALERGFRRILLAGHPGKLLKLIRGDFMTHSSKSESAVPLIMEELSRADGEPADQDYYKNLQTVEGFIQSLPQDVSRGLFGRLADGVQHAAENYVDGKMEIGVILLSMRGAVVGESIGSRGWRTDR